MTVYSLDPLRDPRWEVFVQTHPAASVFHSPGWLLALQASYGYSCVAYTTSAPVGPLVDGLVVCLVNSWLTGRRLVSVPFADHAEPLLAADGNAAPELFGHLREVRKRDNLRYIELRPTSLERPPEGFCKSEKYVLHVADLQPPTSELFNRLHKDSIQRKIRRAERDGVHVRSGQADGLLKSFYTLHTRTRRRHGWPPQPRHWFDNLRTFLGERFVVHVAMRGTHPIASIVTLEHNGTLFYKYGASDAREHASGAMPLLLWTAMEQGKHRGLTRLDLGRSDPLNQGLVKFKSRFGTIPTTLTYARNPGPRPTGAVRRPMEGIARRLVQVLPDAVLSGIGRIAYRHVG